MTTTIMLGKTGIQIAPLGIGTWAWGDKLVWGYGKGYGEEDLNKGFQAALAAGISLFDTAELYGWGNSERLLGQFLQKRSADAPPCVIASKFFPYPWRLGKGALRSALTGSLKRLGVSRIDLYQIHWPSPLFSVTKSMDAMADLVADGLIGAVGASNYNVAQTRQAHELLAKRGIALASNQIEYSLLQRKPESNGLLDLCHELGVTLIAYSPLAMGMLSGKYTVTNPPSGARRRIYKPDVLRKLEPLTRLLGEIGERNGGKTPSQVALNWLIGKGTVPIPGAKNVEQTQQNAGALGWQLSAADMAALDEASKRVR